VRLVRPRSIIWFERLYLVSALLSALSAVLVHDELVAEFRSDPELLWLSSEFVTALLFTFSAVNFLLWYLIAREGRTGAKWTLMAILIVPLAVLPEMVEAAGTTSGILDLVSAILAWLAAPFLFRRDARGWFRKQPTVSPDLFE
jgi:hypothetical protein